MKLTQLPINLWELFKHRKKFAKLCEYPNPEWYASSEGKAAYDNAKTPAQKTKYFYDYLTAGNLLAVKTRRGENALESFKKRHDILYSMAYVMANSMDSSSLKFAGYPNILDASKNPLVSLVIKDEINDPSLSKLAVGLFLLAKLTEFEGNMVKAEDQPYKALEFTNEKTEKASDMYKIQRDIIGAFILPDKLAAEYEDFVPPYLYAMVYYENKLNFNWKMLSQKEIYNTLEGVAE